MIIGSPTRFGLESEATQYYEKLSLRALGFFVIHVLGVAYGVHRRNATILASSFDAITRRIRERGQHTCPFATESNPVTIAKAVETALYEEEQTNELLLGIDILQFSQMLTSKGLLWAPDGDAAFDDGSRVLQFDEKGLVRLVAYKRTTAFSEPQSLRDLWMEESEFYALLQQWRDSFRTEWEARVRD